MRGIPPKRAGNECQAEEKDEEEKDRQSTTVASRGKRGLAKQGRAFFGGITLLFGGIVGVQRAYSFRIDIGKGVKDSFEGMI